MYRVNIDVEAQPAVDALPAEGGPAAVAAFLELRQALELSPHSVGDLGGSSPTANMRTVAFGPAREGLAVWYVVEADRRVEIVRVMWLPSGN